MIFEALALSGAYLIHPELLKDERGFFARSFCQDEFEDNGLNASVAQCNISFNWKKGTLRGMHYQIPPYQETKLVRCTAGAVYDVIIDLRKTSETYCEWISVELSGANRLMLYVPQGFAHGYQTLEDNSEVFYQVSEFYRPESERGVLWNDPQFGIVWPDMNPIISEKDRNHSVYFHA